MLVGGFFGYSVSKKSPVKLNPAMRQEASTGLKVGANKKTVSDKIIHVDVPIDIEIPVLDIQAKIEAVGLDDQNRMDTPKNVYNTGWYMLGVRPGEVGSALIDGHYDTPSGAPSVFYKLNKAKAGDEIYITDKNDERHTFVVYEVNDYHYTLVPMGELVQKTAEKRLHLITCGGKWDKNEKTYTNRTVVSARMAE